MGLKPRQPSSPTGSAAVTFPFVGAGAAEYFEWAELFVRFARSPSEAERDAVAADVPPPLRDTIAWRGPLLHVASEQGVGRLIRASYGGRQPVQPAQLTVRSRFAQASATADVRFNAHIDAWLAAANTVIPILVAFRRQDWEAGGTALSDWHRDSIRRVPAILATMVDDGRLDDAPLMGRLARWAGDEGVDVDAAVLAGVRELEARATDAREAREAAEQEENARRASAVDARLRDDAVASRARPTQSPVEVAAAFDALDAVLPKLAKRLRRLDPSRIAIAPGASAGAIARAEAALGFPLAPAHRALLSAFDGGRLGDVVVLGTPEGGARGADDLVDYAVSHGLVPFWLVVARSDDSGRVITMRPGKDAASHVEDSGLVIRGYRHLDAALDAVVKAGRL